MKLLIGYGNTLRRDDGVGWLVADQLAPHDDAELRVIAAHQLLPEMAARIAQVSYVVFVDAAIVTENIPAGTVTVCELVPLDYFEEAHAFTPPGLMHLARYLYGACPPAHLLTITGADFGLGESLSPGVQAALPHAINAARRLLGI